MVATQTWRNHVHVASYRPCPLLEKQLILPIAHMSFEEQRGPIPVPRSREEGKARGELRRHERQADGLRAIRRG